jgi:hypothetical protein
MEGGMPSLPVVAVGFDASGIVRLFLASTFRKIVSWAATLRSSVRGFPISGAMNNSPDISEAPPFSLDAGSGIGAHTCGGKNGGRCTVALHLSQLQLCFEFGCERLRWS